MDSHQKQAKNEKTLAPKLDDEIIDAITCDGKYLWDYPQRKAIMQLITQKQKDAYLEGTNSAKGTFEKVALEARNDELYKALSTSKSGMYATYYEQRKAELKAQAKE